MKRFLAAGLLAGAMAPAGVLHAWEEGPYLGFAIGATDYDLGLSDYDDGNIVSGSVDNSSTGYKIFGGYRLTPNVAVELYFADLGDTGFRGQAAGAAVEHWCFGTVDSKVEADGFGLSLLGNVPVGRNFNLYGKFGIFGWDAKARETDSCGRFVDSDSGTELTFGAGASYQLNYRTSVQLEWERYRDIFDSFDVDFISLGLSFDLY